MMDKIDTDERLREALRLAKPSVEADSFCRALKARLAADNLKVRPRVSRHLVLAALAAVVVLTGLSVGILETVAHVGHHSILIIPTMETTVPKATTTTLSSSSSTAPGPSTTTGIRPSIGETQLQQATQVPILYFSYLRAGKSADFTKLLGPGIGIDPATLWPYERENLKRSGQATYIPSSFSSLVWAGDWYLPPTDMVPTDIDRWIRTDPSNRVGFKVTMEDGSFRYLRVEYQSKSDKWLLIPTEWMLGETSANVPDIEFATEQTKALAEQMIVAIAAEFPALADAVISEHGVQDVPTMRVFRAHFVDDLVTSHWVLTVVLQKDVTDISRVAPGNSSSVNLAGSISGWEKDNLPFNAQIVILLPDGTTVNVSESALHTDEGEGHVPLDIPGLRRVVELMAQQFGTVRY